MFQYNQDLHSPTLAQGCFRKLASWRKCLFAVAILIVVITGIGKKLLPEESGQVVLE